MEIIIQKFWGDWYCFDNIDQSNNFIKVGSLRFATDRKAINQAKKLSNNKKAKFIIKEVKQ